MNSPKPVRILYFDTSIWRRLDDEENPDLRRVTRRFVNTIGARSVVRTSALVAAELKQVPFLSVRRKAIRKLKAGRARVVTTSSDVHRTVRELLEEGCLSERHLEDLYHIGYSLVGRVDFLVTWDTGDLARRGTQEAVRRLCVKARRPELVIDTPIEVAKWLDVKIG